jgi:hypothetical protein
MKIFHDDFTILEPEDDYPTVLSKNYHDVQPDKLPLPFFGMGGRIALTLYWWFYRIFHKTPKSFDETIKALDTPLKVQAWLYANITYTSDKTALDEWQPAERTYTRRKGDCEDWAVFAMRCLQKIRRCYYICMYTNSSGHAELLLPADNESSDLSKVKKWISIGTFGYKVHTSQYPSLVRDWSNYKDWKFTCLKDSSFHVISSHNSSSSSSSISFP